MGGRIKFLVLTDPEKIWKPDLFFSNEKEGAFHNIIMPNVLVRIWPNGDVLYSVRISLVLFCPMNLQYFPLDLQMCTIKMASCKFSIVFLNHFYLFNFYYTDGYTTDDVVFLWKEGDPVQIVKNLYLSRFTLLNYKTSYCTSKTNTGAYSCVAVDMKFKREFSYYLILIYVPTCMLVIVSWVSFWIDPNSSAARVVLGIISLMTMSRQISSINSSLPPVSYTKAVDVWTGACLLFVFSALMEFAVVNYVSRHDRHQGKRAQAAAAFQGTKRKRVTKWDIDSKNNDSGCESDDIDQLMQPQNGLMDFTQPYPKPRKIPVTDSNPGFIRRWLDKFPTRSKRVDVISRVTFPLVFAAFNILYWIKYLFRDDLKDVDI